MIHRNKHPTGSYYADGTWLYTCFPFPSAESMEVLNWYVGSVMDRLWADKLKFNSGKFFWSAVLPDMAVGIQLF